MRPFKKLTSKLVPLPVDNVDTDQIIPARYLTTVSREGLGEGLFDAWRYTDGRPNSDFSLNRPEYEGGEVLLSGENFGCGSSREHAVWALMDYGFRAVIASSFADIFRNNSLKNGLLPIALKRSEIEQLQGGQSVTVDLEAQEVQCGEKTFTFSITNFRKECIFNGLDDLGYLLQRLPLIERFETA